MVERCNEGPAFVPVPPGNVRTENSDGVTQSGNMDPKHNLYDNTGRPQIPVGDWSVHRRRRNV